MGLLRILPTDDQQQDGPGRRDRYLGMDPPPVEARPRRVRFRLAVPHQGDARVGGRVGSAWLEAQGRSARESGALEETGPSRGRAPSRVAMDRGSCGAWEE